MAKKAENREEKSKAPAEIKYLSVDALADLIQRANAEGGRFCFVLGSGASVESGIPDGKKLEMDWMNCLMGEANDQDAAACYPRMVEEWARGLQSDGRLKNSFEELKEEWEKAKAKGERTLSSDYYSDIYRLRFFTNRSNGYRYLERIMEKAQPSIGYHTLSLLMTKENSNNLLITTNFDSLVEDALAIYSEKRPLVIAHESLADYMDVDTSRPIIAKVHRGLFFEPLNTTEETDKLHENWKPALRNAFRRYAPIVIGYAGGDQSLMAFLKEPDTQMKQGLFWCIREGSEPSERIKELVKAKGGCFVRIPGFDGMMMRLGLALFPEDISPAGTKQLLKAQYERRLEDYNEQFNNLNEEPGMSEVAETLKQETDKQSNPTETARDYANRAFEKSLAGELENAIDLYNECIKLNPGYASAYNNRGSAYARLGNYKEAFENYNQAIALKPDYAKAYNNRGSVLSKLKPPRYEEAIKDFNRAIDLKPDYAFAYNNRGAALRNLKRYDEAIEDYTRAIELKPDYALAYRNRAAVYRELGHNDLAEADEARAKELEARNKING